MADPRIVAVVTHVVRCDVPPSWAFPTASFVSAGAPLVEVVTDAGAIGWGEPSPYGAPLPELLRTLAEDGERLVGATVTEAAGRIPRPGPERIHAYGRAARSAVAAGLSQAVWDLRGQLAGRPVHALLAEELGRPVTAGPAGIEAYASAGMFFDGASADDYVAEALRLRALGYRAYKLRPTTARSAGSHFERAASPPPVDIAALIEVAGALRAAMGPDHDLMLDVGRRIPTLDEAVELCEALTEFGFRFVEEPLAGGLDDHRTLRARVGVPVAGGEQFVDAAELARWAERGGFDVVQPDAGLAGIDEIVDHLRTGPHTEFVPHSWANAVSIAANVHLAVAAGAALIESNETFNPMRDELVAQPYRPVDGRIMVDDRPGLGIEIDRDALARFAA